MKEEKKKKNKEKKVKRDRTKEAKKEGRLYSGLPPIIRSNAIV